MLALAAASSRKDCHLLALNISALTSPTFSPAAKPLFCLHTSFRCLLQVVLGFLVSSTSSQEAMWPCWIYSLPLPALISFCSGPVVPYPSVISPGMSLPPGLCTCHSLPGMLFTQGPGCFSLVSFRTLLRYQDVTWRRLWTPSFKLLPLSSALASHLLCFISPFSSWHIASQVALHVYVDLAASLTRQSAPVGRDFVFSSVLHPKTWNRADLQ